MSGRLSSDQIERARATPIEIEIARRGITLKGKIERVGPCPICGGGVDRFAINVRKQAWHCRGCGKGGDVIALIMHLDSCDFTEAVELLSGGARSRPVREAPREQQRDESADEYERRQHEKAAWIWQQRRPLAGTIGERYLREARGYGGPLPPTLGFLPARGEYLPAVVAAFGLCDEPEPGELASPRYVGAVHITRLRDDGTGKADVEPSKIIVGSPGASPIVLAPCNDLFALTVTEGIEDALSAHQALATGAWAAGSAGAMSKLAAAVPSYIETLTIFAHPDKAGVDGAHALAAALRARAAAEQAAEVARKRRRGTALRAEIAVEGL